MMNLDPRNITMEPEYYVEVDTERYYRVTPLLWLWQMFDKSPLGHNVHLALRFRRLLAQHIFKRCGRNFKCFNFVEFSAGYNLEVGNDVVVHRHVLLDDRGGIILGDRVSISDYANIYSHTHSIVDQRNVTLAPTVLEDDVRITYHATVLAGVAVGRNAMGGRQGRRDPRRPAISRQRRHTGQVGARETDGAARHLGDDYRRAVPPSSTRLRDYSHVNIRQSAEQPTAVCRLSTKSSAKDLRRSPSDGGLPSDQSMS